MYKTQPQMQLCHYQCQKDGNLKISGFVDSLRASCAATRCNNIWEILIDLLVTLLTIKIVHNYHSTIMSFLLYFPIQQSKMSVKCQIISSILKDRSNQCWHSGRKPMRVLYWVMWLLEHMIKTRFWINSEIFGRIVGVYHFFKGILLLPWTQLGNI